MDVDVPFKKLSVGMGNRSPPNMPDGYTEDANFDNIISKIAKHRYMISVSRLIDFRRELCVKQKIQQEILAKHVAAEELRRFHSRMDVYHDLQAEIASEMAINRRDYAVLAARNYVSYLYMETKTSFSEVMHDLYYAKNPITSQHAPIISEHYYNIIKNIAEKLDSVIIYDRDLKYNYIDFETLEKNYLLKINGKIVERPQHMLMRVAVGIHENDVDKVIETYNYLSERYFIHATPTLLNACTNIPMSSCFLLTLQDDSVKSVFSMLEKCVCISNYGGGIGLSIHCIRAKNAEHQPLQNSTNRLVSILNLYNQVVMMYGGGKRPAELTVYLEPWHACILDFLKLKGNIGDENMRVRDGLWIPDLFMERVWNGEMWSLMCPSESPGLADVWGDNFKELYTRYEREGRYTKQVEARTVWSAILSSQIVTGTPYMVYKDHCNRKSNHQHLGTIKCSNLCTEIVQYSGPGEVAVCNLASVAVNMFVNTDTKTFDFDKLKTIVKIVTRNLNTIIDVNFYPMEEMKLSNKRHRPIGIGIQGLADAFLLLRYPFESQEAKELNIKIFETLYYGALEASCELAAEKGTYESYPGSPVSKGILQYDMWNVKPTDLWDWNELKAKIAKHGVRNSLLIASMPTASTAQILGNNESVGPYTNNIERPVRPKNSKTLSFVNPHLYRDLIARGLLDSDMVKELLANNGSVQNITRFPDDLKMLYKTVWEIPQKVILEMAADRGPFIDQSQSMNVHISDLTTEELTWIHFFGWKSGLKTGMYHLRTKTAPNPI